MVRQDKSKPGRTTPKGTVPKGKSTPSSSFSTVSDSVASADTGGFASERMSDRPLEVRQSSPIIVPILMFAGLGLGFAMILGNYLVEGFLGTPNNWYLVGGLGLVLFGIIAATQYR